MKKSSPLFLIILNAVIVLIFSNIAIGAGFALSFDGSNDYVHLNHRALAGLNDCTVEYWVLIVRDDEAASPISAAASNNDNDEYLHYFDFEEGIRPHIHEESPENGRGFPHGQWFHFALSRDGESGDWIAYINGEEVDNGSLPRGPLDVAVDGLVLGQEQDAVEGRFDRGEALRGSLDEMRIWSTVRTSAQINAYMHSNVPENSFGLNAYYMFDEGEGQVLGDLTNHDYHGRLGETNEIEFSDPRWENSNAPIYGGIADISAEAVTFGPVVQDRLTEFVIRIENVAEVDDDFHAFQFTFEDEELDPDWLEIDPVEGELAAGESIEITFTANPEGLELGEYEREVDFEINAANVQSLTIPATMIIVDGLGSLAGNVTDEADGEPVAGAIIRATENFPYMRITDEDGNYEFNELPAYNYTFEADADDYILAVSDEFEVADGEDVELNFSLFHAEFSPEPGGIERIMETNQQVETAITITNNGNADLIWSMDVLFPDLEESPPWEHLHTIPTEEILENNRIGSVIFIGDHFYVAAGVQDDDNIIYVLNREGEIVREFSQHGESGRGYRDMTWDGELIWAYDDRMIFGFDTEGNLEQSFESPEDPLRGITWDIDNGHFWICDRTSDIWAMDIEGNILEEINRPEEALRIYGLTWYSRDVDDFYLYASCQNGEFSKKIYKINPENGDVMFMHEPLNIQGVIGSSFISGLWDPNRYSFISMSDRPDNIEIWEIEPRSEWLTAEPNEGEVEPGGEDELTITLNTSGLPEEVQYNGTLHFTHNADDGMYEFLVTIIILGEGGMAERTIPLSFGWNLISTNVEPLEDEADFADILAPLVDAGLVVMAKDGEGNFYVPEENFGDIGDWQWMSGYWLKMSGTAELTIAGEIVSWNTPMNLTEGWNMISFLPRNGVNPAGALRNLGDALIIVKDGDGLFYIPEWGFSNIGQMQEGKGYQVKVIADIELVYSLRGNQDDSSPSVYSYEDRRWMNALTKSIVSHSLLLIVDDALHEGARMEAYTPDGILAGRGVVDGTGRIGMALWGDDPSTSVQEGFRTGDKIELTNLKGNAGMKLTNLEGTTGSWKTDGWGVARIDVEAVPFEFGLGRAYPNPFNSRTIISFTLKAAESISLNVFDISGRKVTTLVAGDYTAGQHRVLWDALEIPSGIYSLHLKSNSGAQSQKVVLLK